MEAPKAGVELKSIAGMKETVELGLGEQMRTPGCSGAVQSAEAIFEKQETTSKVSKLNDKIRIN